MAFKIRIKINGMKPVWASPGMNALGAFTGYKAYKGLPGYEGLQIILTAKQECACGILRGMNALMAFRINTECACGIPNQHGMRVWHSVGAKFGLTSVL
ncbi:MAG: hypothetical protein OXU36_08555 [Candidatus Poribacteria bacterium]|nr:hypothetical protein [Candidatus Poribacteria bacterium]